MDFLKQVVKSAKILKVSLWFSEILPQLVVQDRIKWLFTKKMYRLSEKTFDNLWFIERNFQVKLGTCLYITFSMSKLDENSFYKFRNILGGVWVMGNIEISFFLVFLFFLYRKSIIFPVFLQEIQTPGNVPL